jgi:hypothetical protein
MRGAVERGLPVLGVMRWSYLSLVVSLLLSGCSGVGAFEVPIELQESRVAGSLVGGLLPGFLDVPIPLDVDLEAETAARDAGPVQHVRFSALSFTITTTAEPSGDTDDFAFVDEARIYVESAQSGSTLPRVQVAILGQPPSGARDISFDTDETIDLLPYIEEGARLTSEATGRQPPDDVTFVGLAVLTAEVL